jgi:hypothetical protein
MDTKSLREMSADAVRYWERHTILQGNPMGAISIIALMAAAAMFVTACAEADNKAGSSNEQGRQRKARGAVVTNSQQQQGFMHPEAEYDFGDAAAYYNEHPSGGK